ncbi:MAG: helix-turn-helix domain-containing protein [Eggerthellaceae bacterium]|nr:helix-turn-helix domain-containing protein [Eggerthellaceae bacterium]
MKPGYDVIADILFERFGVESSVQGEDFEFGLPGLVRSPSDSTDSDLLVVAASGRDAISHERGKLLILAGDDWSSSSAQGLRSPSILVQNASPETVFAVLMKVFSQAIEWEMNINEALEHQSTIQTLLDITRQVLGNPVVFYDDKLEEYTLSMSASDDALASKLNPMHEQVRAKNIPLEMFNNEELQRYLAQEGPFLTNYTYPGIDDVSIMVNAPVHEGGVHGIVCTRVLHGEVRRIYFWYIAHLAHAIERYYRNTVARVSSGRIDIHGALRSLIDGSADRHTVLQFAESHIGERMRIVCGVARFFDKRSRNIPLSYLCEKAEQALGDHAAIFEMDGDIIACIWSETADSAFAAAERIASLLEHYGAVVGCSNAFDSAIDLSAHIVQAKRAVDLSADEAGALHRFSDVAVRYLLRYGTTELDVHHVMAPGFVSLLAYNASSPVDYIDTLRQFFALGGNVSALARACDINRSTLLFRLRQIESVAGLHLEDSSDRLYLELSLRLYDNR